jgi:hypothetical protein
VNALRGRGALQDLIDIDLNLHRLIFLAKFFPIGLRGRDPCLSHRSFVILVGLRIQCTLATFRVFAMGRLTKMGIRIFFVDLSPANVAHANPARATHFIAAITFDKGGLAFGTLANLGFANGFFHFESPFVLSFLLNHLVATERNVGRFTAFSTGFKLAIFHGTLKDHLSRRQIRLKIAFRTGARKEENGK